ncbi:hypothetical protein [Pelosinus sp. HCF1]|nr:hypothetical protein [Pelosinus sp. HCF1]
MILPEPDHHQELAESQYITEYILHSLLALESYAFHVLTKH